MIGAEVKSSFFDRKRVIDAVGKAGAASLSKAGAFIRRTAKGLMKSGGKKNKVAPPGTPPRVHAGQLKDLLYFGFDTSKATVVIGPVKFGDGEAPGLLEFGGTAQRKGRDGKSHTETYRGNPFMQPALDENIPKLPDLWANSVSS